MQNNDNQTNLDSNDDPLDSNDDPQQNRLSQIVQSQRVVLRVDGDLTSEQGHQVVNLNVSDLRRNRIATQIPSRRRLLFLLVPAAFQSLG